MERLNFSAKKLQTLGLALSLWSTALNGQSSGLNPPASATPSPTTADSQRPLIVSIDNPSFRKLIMAIPPFEVDASAKEDIKKLGAQGASELGRLLNFSGMFGILDPSAYQDILKSKSKQQAAINLVEGVDLPQWKTIGTEAVTLATLSTPREGMVLEIKTVDINQGRLIVGKRYRNIKPKEFSLVLRRYADRLLEAYTGKGGIFSSQIVFIGRRAKRDHKQVFVCDFDGSNVRQITKKQTTHLSPAWSHNGQYLSFTSYEDGNPDLWVYEIATGTKRKISGHKGLNSGSNWSPNDKVVVFTGSVNGDADIYTMPFAGGKRRPLIKGTGLEVDPVFSPDGQSLAYVSGRYGNPHIFVGSLKWEGDAKVKVLSEKRITYAGWYNSTPSWSPEGILAFAGYDKEIDRYDIFVVDPSNIKKLDRLTIKTGDNEDPSWSPNGQLIVFQSDRTKGRDVKGRKQLYIMNRDGGAQRMLVTGLYDAQTPVWGPPLAN